MNLFYVFVLFFHFLFVFICCFHSYLINSFKLRPREKAALDYNARLIETYSEHPEVRRIAKHRFVPKSIYRYGDNLEMRHCLRCGLPILSCLSRIVSFLAHDWDLWINALTGFKWNAVPMFREGSRQEKLVEDDNKPQKYKKWREAERIAYSFSESSSVFSYEFYDRYPSRV